MKLNPGYYKVQDKESHFGDCHHLRVFIDPSTKEKMLQVDGGVPMLASDHEKEFLDFYVLVKSYSSSRPIGVRKAEIIINWTDDDGDGFSVTGRNIFVIVSYLLHFKRVAKALQIDKVKVGLLGKLFGQSIG